MVTLASGTRVSLRFVREAVRGTTPVGVGTATTGLSAAAGTGGVSTFTRASGSFVTDGYTAGQTVKTTGFTNTANNADWEVSSVTATVLTVVDAGAAIVDETAASANTVEILMETLRATQRAANLEKNLLESEEVDADGQETDVRHGFNRVAGPVGFELARADFDDPMEFVTGGTWTTVVTTGAPQMSVSGSTFVRATGSFIADGFRPGDIVRTTGFANTANNADWRVSSVTATVLTVVDTASVLSDETDGTGKDIQLPGKRIDVASTLKSFTLERAFADVVQYQLFKGTVIDQMQLSISPERMVGGTFTMLGMSSPAFSASPLSSYDPVAAAGTSPLAAFDGLIYEGGSVISVVTSLDFTLNRRRSLTAVVGSRFSPDVFEGTARIEGTVAALFEDATLYNKFVNETESSVWTRLDDPTDATHFINVVLPRIKYNGANMDPAQEGPVSQDMPFRALKATGLAGPSSTTVNTMMTIQRSNA